MTPVRLGQDFYQTYARTRVERGFFPSPFCPKTQENKQKMPRNGTFFFRAKARLRATLVIFPSERPSWLASSSDMSGGQHSCQSRFSGVYRVCCFRTPGTPHQSRRLFNSARRRTNVQQLTCKIDLSISFYYLFFSFVLLELKPFVLKGKNSEKVPKSVKKCEKL